MSEHSGSPKGSQAPAQEGSSTRSSKPWALILLDGQMLQLLSIIAAFLASTLWFLISMLNTSSSTFIKENLPSLLLLYSLVGIFLGIPYSSILALMFYIGVRRKLSNLGPQTNLDLGEDPFKTHLLKIINMSIFIANYSIISIILSLFIISLFKILGNNPHIYVSPIVLSFTEALIIFSFFFISSNFVIKFFWKYLKCVNGMEIIIRIEFLIRGLDKITKITTLLSEDFSHYKLEKMVKSVDLHFRKLNEYLAMYLSDWFPNYSLMRLSYLGRKFSFKKVPHNEFMNIPYSLRFKLSSYSTLKKLTDLRYELLELRNCLKEGCRLTFGWYMRGLWDYLSEGIKVSSRKLLIPRLGVLYYSLPLLPGILTRIPDIIAYISQYNIQKLFNEYLILIITIPLFVITILSYTLSEMRELSLHMSDKFIEVLLKYSFIFVIIIAFLIVIPFIYSIMMIIIIIVTKKVEFIVSISLLSIIFLIMFLLPLCSYLIPLKTIKIKRI